MFRIWLQSNFFCKISIFIIRDGSCETTLMFILLDGLSLTDPYLYALFDGVILEIAIDNVSKMCTIF